MGDEAVDGCFGECGYFQAGVEEFSDSGIIVVVAAWAWGCGAEDIAHDGDMASNLFCHGGYQNSVLGGQAGCDELLSCELGDAGLEKIELKPFPIQRECLYSKEKSLVPLPPSIHTIFIWNEHTIDW